MLPIVLESVPVESVILWPWEIKGPIDRSAVMFDVLAASYNIIHLAGKAQRLFTVTEETVADALELFPDAVLIGETDDLQLYEMLKDRFIASNSPTVVVRADVDGKDVILITNNGTHTLAELIDHQANPVIVGHWVNIGAVIEYLRALGSSSVYLVPSGGREERFKIFGGKLMEDWYCAEAMADLLAGKPHDYNSDFSKSKQSIRDQYNNSKEDELVPILLQANITRTVPVCYQLSHGIIEVKA